MTEETLFEHRGHTFKVTDTKPDPSTIKAGSWVRICHDPYEGKSDIVALVLSCKLFWPRNPSDIGPAFLEDDYLLQLARNGDQADVFKQRFSEDYIELVELVLPQTLHPTEDLPKKAHRANLDIVVCLDGTWNENERQDTNVHRITRFVDRNHAIINYYSGVGVGGLRLQNGLDGMSGRGVFRTVRSAFTFVRANHKDGDRIFIFGFSRGAYAARHLAGMIARIGVNAHPEIGFDDYRRSVVDASSDYVGFNGTNVHFLGLFDCVPGNQIYAVKRANRRMNNPVVESAIRNVAHAVSQDERRWSFRPLILKKNGQQLFSQRWFPGCHFDIGGDQNEPLNNFVLTWILTHALRCGLSLSGGLSQEFDPTAPPKPWEYVTTKLGITCRRSEVEGADLVESAINREQLRKTISDLTRL